MTNNNENLTATELGIRTAHVASMVIIGKILNLTIGVLTFVIVAKLLGPSNYGLYAVALGVAGFIGAFGNLSIGTYFNKYIPKYVSKKDFESIGIAIGDSLILLLLIGLLLTLIGYIFSSYITTYFFHNSIYIDIVYVSVISILFNMISSSMNSVLISFGNGKDAAIQSVMNVIFQFFSSIILVTAGYGALGAILGYTLGLLASSIVGIILVLKHSKIIFSKSDILKRLKYMFNFSNPLTFTTVLNTLVNNFAILLLGLLFLPEVVGTYSIASRIGNLIDVISGSMGVVLVPMFASAIYNKDTLDKVHKFYFYSIYFGSLFTAPVIVYTSVFSKAITFTFFSSAYNNAILYIPLISIGIFVGLLGTFASSLMISLGKVNQVLKYAFISGVIQTIALLVLVPLFGAIGAIVSLLYIGGILLDYFYMKYVKNEIKIEIDSKLLFKVLIANLIITILLFPLLALKISQKTELILGNMITISFYPAALMQLALGGIIIILIYPITLGVMKAITKDEMYLLEKVAKRLPLFDNLFIFFINYVNRFVK